jgi:colanic acid biosynthesis protein WcaH
MTATKTLSIRRNFITEISSASATIDPTDTDINAAISVLERSIDNASVGLREELFRFVSRLTVMVNIDLLVKDELNRVLLSWRETEFSGAGWHVPGGIIR